MERGRKGCPRIRIFSATVASFIIESYKMLSPDSGDQTVFLLGQMSQQLSGLANGTTVHPQQYPSYSPSASIICVNVVWLLSLVFSTTSALLATLTQQWARRYIQYPKVRAYRASERAFVRFCSSGLGNTPCTVRSNWLRHSSTFLYSYSTSALSCSFSRSSKRWPLSF
ncbi:hypothetical protein BC827DRAFT_174699 [Russula dissimulans]|nr:hypothetical protein BC827DRAFT_174699 [Russula dissimulans]